MRRTLLLVTLNVAAAGFFVLSPEFDLAVSRHLYSAVDGFHLGSSQVLLLIRDTYRTATTWIIVGFGAVILAKLWKPRLLPQVPMRAALFVVSSYVIVAGLAVSLVKAIFDRPRPRHLTEFGGSLDFSRAWQDVDACVANCSFFSGEAAAATAMLSLVVLVPRAYRTAALAVLAPMAIVASLNRVAFGAHFLSDVVAASLFTLLAMDLIWKMLNACGPQDRSRSVDNRTDKQELRPSLLSRAAVLSIEG